MLDHLIYAAIDLDAAVRDLEARLGVQAIPGGQHPGRGTRNALLSLGNDTYLEIIGPDPDQSNPAQPLSFRGGQAGERLAGWAAKAPDIAARAARATAAGYDPGPVAAGSRAQPDGAILRWQATPFSMAGPPQLIPFLIDWGDTPHPSSTAPGGIRLLSFRAESPDPAPVREALQALNVDLPVGLGPEPRLIAELEGPAGRVTLR